MIKLVPSPGLFKLKKVINVVVLELIVSAIRTTDGGKFVLIVPP